MKVAFHVYGFGLRGTEVATYDYAHFNRTILGHESVIVAPASSRAPNTDVFSKFASELEIVYYTDRDDLARRLNEIKADVFYCQKGGHNDGIAVDSVKTCVHAVFRSVDFHGHEYAYISEWLAREMTGGEKPYVPYVVRLPDVAADMRRALGIPKKAIVFGRYGGESTFNIRFVHDAVRTVARRRPDIYFLFMNTKPILRSRWLRSPLRRDNIIYLLSTADPVAKTCFINTCDAMLHARADGETFGLAVAEFSIRNKPVLTYSGSEDRAHIAMLGSKGLLYSNAAELTAVLENFRPDPGADWDVYSKRYSPERVMAEFQTVFLDSNASYGMPAPAFSRGLKH